MTGHMFFTAISGSQYPVTGIAAIWPAHNTGKGWPKKANTVLLSEDKRVEVDEFEAKAIIDAPRHIIPAEAGTFTLGGVVPGDKPGDVWRFAVLAWAICGQGFPTPITVDGMNDGMDEGVTILLPDGSVHERGNRSWRTFDNWFADAIEEAEKLAAEKASAE